MASSEIIRLRTKTRLKSTISLLLLYSLSQICSTYAFQCYVCDSKVDIECTEILRDDTKLTAKDCGNIIGAKYCVKTTNIYAGEFGTKRFCSANDHGNYCKYIKQPTGEREYRSCVLTCDTELCNGSSSLTITGFESSCVTIFTVLVSILIIKKFI